MINIIPSNTLDDDFTATCNIYNPNSFSSKFASDHSVLIMHHNIRSFSKNFDELSVFIDSLVKKVDVLVLSETWFNSDNKIPIEGYKDYHSVRTTRQCGGVSIYIKNSLSSNIIEDFTVNHDFIETVVVRIKISHTNYMDVIGVYRPPESPLVTRFNHFMNDMLTNRNLGKTVYVAGDLNINLLNLDNNGTEFVDYMKTNAFLPLITLPTRQNNLLDQIWTNNLDEIESGVLPCSITDHYPVFAIIKSKPEHDVVKKCFRDHSNINIEFLRFKMDQFISTFDIFNDLSLNQQCNIFLDNFEFIYQSCCPLREKIISASKLSKPWITDTIKRSIAEKHRRFFQYKNGDATFESYNNYKNMLTIILRQAKSQYFKNKFASAANNIKKTWQTINQLLQKRKIRNKVELLDNGRHITDSQEVCGVFNDYFTNIACELDSNIPPANTDPLSYMCPPSLQSLVAIPSTTDEVIKLLDSFPTKGGQLSEIPVFIYKEVSDIIAPIISELFNKSITEGAFPDACKTARVVPIHKKGPKIEVQNYRPISTLPVLSKIFEKLMSSRLISYLNKYNIISSHQFGFRARMSTADALLEFLEHAYKTLNNKEILFCIFLDFAKAFDTVNHKILLAKLERIGIRGPILQWFISYLENRKQYVMLDDAKSTCKTITMGVPQGSVLGPILFLIYINDMYKSTADVQFIHFADDTTVFKSSKNTHELEQLVNKSLSDIDKWLISNRLSLNVTKSSYMVITNKTILDDPVIKIRGQPLNRVTEAKFLGIVLDDKLTFKAHVNSVCSKLSRARGIMYRISPFISHDIILKLYYSIFYPYITYCIPVWGNASAECVNRVSSLQKRAIKLLTYQRSLNEVYKQHKLLRFPDIFKYFSVLKLFKILNGEHNYLLTQILDNQINHRFPTRNKANKIITLPFSITVRGEKSIIYQGTIHWNNLPLYIRESTTVEQFKRLVKKHYINQL